MKFKFDTETKTVNAKSINKNKQRKTIESKSIYLVFSGAVSGNKI